MKKICILDKLSKKFAFKEPDESILQTFEFAETNKTYLYSDNPFVVGPFNCFNSTGDIGSFSTDQ